MDCRSRALRRRCAHDLSDGEQLDTWVGAAAPGEGHERRGLLVGRIDPEAADGRRLAGRLLVVLVVPDAKVRGRGCTDGQPDRPGCAGPDRGPPHLVAV